MLLNLIHFRWQRDNGTRKLPRGHSEELLSSIEDFYIFTLQLKNLRIDNCGTYTCEIFYDHHVNNTRVTAGTIDFNVTVIPKSENYRNRCHRSSIPSWVEFSDIPWITRPSRTIPVPLQNSIRIDCLPKSYKARKALYWMLPNGIKLKSGHNADNFTVLSNGSLLIEKMRPTFQGTYRCIADTVLNLTSNVYIPMPATIGILPKYYKTYAGCNIKLHCKAVGDEPLKLNLMIPEKNAGRGKVQYAATTFQIKLLYVIRKIQVKDSGVYECKAKNGFGPESTTRIRLLVIQKAYTEVLKCAPTHIVIIDDVRYKLPYEIDKTEKEEVNHNVELFHQNNGVALTVLQIPPALYLIFWCHIFSFKIN